MNKREKAVSKSSHTIKVFRNDEAFITKKIKEFNSTDLRFVSYSAAIRHYVSEGIIAETENSSLRSNLNKAIVKSNQKEAVRDELKPLTDNLKNLDDTIGNSTVENNRIYSDLVKRTTDIEAKLDNDKIEASKRLDYIIKISEYTLRNIIVIRTIIYVFLLGIKAGKIEPGFIHRRRWRAMVTTAHDNANKQSIKEVISMSDATFESAVIQETTVQILDKMKSIDETAPEPAPNVNI